jgi:NAD(P)-dependent dehydrogenase (short-subunit alcohol dehydrogenase family)
MDKIAVVTGAASGIGESTATRLRNAGWMVVALDLRLDGDGHCDVGDVASVNATFERIGARFGYVDALVCSAGTLKIGALADMAPEDFDQLYRINTRGAWLCARQAIPLMRKSPNRLLFPRIVFVGSISGIRPKIGNGAYAAQKAALHTLTGVMAAELGPEGILVNAVAPGTVDTPMIGAMSDPAKSGRYRPSGLSPLGRVATPDDIAAVIDFCLNSQANYVTGAVIPVDGGTRAAYVPPSA